MAVQTNTFKGARYVPKFADPIEWSADTSYEAIESVQHEGFTYLSKQPVPAGVQIDNEEFWLLWADPNAQMEQLRQEVVQYAGNVEELSGVVGQWGDELAAEIEARKADPPINVKYLGVTGNGQTDDYQRLQEIFTEYKGQGKTLYFPAGQYNISKTLIIGSDTTVIGDGAKTVFYGTGTTWRNFGTVLALFGSNIELINIGGSYDGYDSIFQDGANFGLIGISHYTFESGVAYATGTGELVVDSETHSNILINGLFTNSHYPLQTEGSNCENVIYNNIYAPNGCISFQSNSQYRNLGLIANNIICSYFRALRGIYSEATNSKGVNVSNVYCNAFNCTIPNSNIENITVNYVEGSAVANWLEHNWPLNAIFEIDSASASNILIDGNSVCDKRAAQIHCKYGNTVINNMKCINFINTTIINFASFDDEYMQYFNNCVIDVDDTMPIWASGIFTSCKMPENVNASNSNIFSETYIRNIGGAGVAGLVADIQEVSGTYIPSELYVYKDEFKWFGYYAFTAISGNKLQTVEMFELAIDWLKPIRDVEFSAFVEDSAGILYPAIFKVNHETGVITLEYKSTANDISRVLIDTNWKFNYNIK